MVKLLLEVGADPETRVDERLTPLYSALVIRHEEVARTISRYIRIIQNFVMNSARMTPLHVSRSLGLYSYAQYFLKKGADVDAKDVKAMTPLHHALGILGIKLLSDII